MGHEALRQCYWREWPLSTVTCANLGVVPIDYHLGASSILKTSAFLCCTSSLAFRISSTELRDSLNKHFLLKLTDANWDIWDVIPAFPVNKVGTRLHNVSIPYSWQVQIVFTFSGLIHFTLSSIINRLYLNKPRKDPDHFGECYCLVAWTLTFLSSMVWKPSPRIGGLSNMFKR